MPDGAEVQNQKIRGEAGDQSQVTEVNQGDGMKLEIRTGGDNPGHGTIKTKGDQDQVIGVLS